MDIDARIPPFTGLRFAGQQGDADFNGHVAGSWPRGEAALCLNRGGQRIHGASEGHEEGVTLRIDFAPAVAGKSIAEDPSVIGECGRRPFVAQAVDQFGGSLDVRKQESDGARW